MVYRAIDENRDGIEAAVAPNSSSSGQAATSDDSAKEGGDASSSSTGGGVALLSSKTAVARPFHVVHGGVDGKSVIRRIIRGPVQFIPAANEWCAQRRFGVICVALNALLGRLCFFLVTRSRGATSFHSHCFFLLNIFRVHKFSWHGSNDRMDDQRTMTKDALKLTKIRTLPDQLYYNVLGCRTQDDAQLTVLF